VVELAGVEEFAARIGESATMDELHQVWIEVKQAGMPRPKVLILKALKDTAKARLDNG
jgi:hypothetical protein